MRIRHCLLATFAAGVSLPIAAPGQDEQTLDTVSVRSGLTWPRLVDVADADADQFRYPRAAIALRREGTVMVVAEIDPDGKVGDVSITESSGYAVLDDAAAAHVRARLFEPARDGGTPIRVRAHIPVTFELEPATPAPDTRIAGLSLD